jgi:hypothetical protein
LTLRNPVQVDIRRGKHLPISTPVRSITPNSHLTDRISYYSHLWEPVLKLAEALHLRSKQPKINYIATADFRNLMDLADFEVISQEERQLLPRRWLGLGPFINRYIAPLPGRQLCLRTSGGAPFSGPDVFREHSHSLP